MILESEDMLRRRKRSPAPKHDEKGNNWVEQNLRSSPPAPVAAPGLDHDFGVSLACLRGRASLEISPESTESPDVQ